MKTMIIALMAFTPFLGHSAENNTCFFRATQYSFNYVIKNYNVESQDITVTSINGNAEIPGPDGFVALGVSLSLSTGQKLTVIPMMTPACMLVDINAFEE